MTGLWNEGTKKALRESWWYLVFAGMLLLLLGATQGAWSQQTGLSRQPAQAAPTRSR